MLAPPTCLPTRASSRSTSFPTNRRRFPFAIDIVVRAKKGAEADYAAISQSLPKLATRLYRNLQRMPEQSSIRNNAPLPSYRSHQPGGGVDQ